ncbi:MULTISPECIES: hypothetical protein [unclassified Modestobacter]
MGQPSGEYSVRSLAEILREHGLESEHGTRPGRRRKGPDEPPTGRSAPVGADGRPAAVEPRPAPAGRGAQSPRPGTSGRPVAPAPGVRPAAARASGPAAPSPAAVRAPAPRGGSPRQADPARSGPPARSAPAPAASPAWTPAQDRSRGSGLGDLASPGPVAGRTESTAAPARRHTDAPDRAAPEPTPAPAAPAPATAAPTPSPATGSVPRGPSTAAIPALQTSASRATGERRSGAHRTGPQPAVPGEGDAEPVSGPQGALAWVRFVGELVVALAVGIGLYFAFTLLWELMPYAALVAAPLVVTGLVAGAAAWRQRQGQGPLPVRLLAGLLLAGTVLVIAPAAGLLAGS